RLPGVDRERASPARPIDPAQRPESDCRIRGGGRSDRRDRQRQLGRERSRSPAAVLRPRGSERALASGCPGSRGPIRPPRSPGGYLHHRPPRRGRLAALPLPRTGLPPPALPPAAVPLELPAGAQDPRLTREAAGPADLNGPGPLRRGSERLPPVPAY